MASGDHVIMEPVNGLVSYFKSLDWSEPWLYCLIASYIVLYSVIYLSRRNSAIQIFTFLFLLLTVYMAEDINETLAKNHRRFTRHQYFDSRGLFISIMMSTPLLLAGAFIAGNWFKESTRLMTQVKALQIRQQAQRQQQYLAQTGGVQRPGGPSSSPAASSSKRRKSEKFE